MTNTAFAADKYDYNRVTGNSKIIETLELLAKTNNQEILAQIFGENQTKAPVKIMFRDLAQISYDCRNFDALTCVDRNGNLYILINIKHKDAPIEAIACLLSHEVIHQDTISSINEETQGWINEAKTWISMKKLNPELKNINSDNCALVKRLNKIEEMYANANYTPEIIQQVVMSNYGYQNLSMNSPGFGI